MWFTGLQTKCKPGGLQACKPGVSQNLLERPAVWFTSLHTRCKPALLKRTSYGRLHRVLPEEFFVRFRGQNVNQVLPGGASRMVDRTANQV